MPPTTERSSPLRLRHDFADLVGDLLKDVGGLGLAVEDVLQEWVELGSELGAIWALILWRHILGKVSIQLAEVLPAEIVVGHVQPWVGHCRDERRIELHRLEASYGAFD